MIMPTPDISTLTMNQLLNRQIVLDRWFTYFLDEFSEKMETLEKTHPINMLYGDKYKEYQTITKQMKLLKARQHV